MDCKPACFLAGFLLATVAVTANQKLLQATPRSTRLSAAAPLGLVLVHRRAPPRAAHEAGKHCFMRRADKLAWRGARPRGRR